MVWVRESDFFFDRMQKAMWFVEGDVARGWGAHGAIIKCSYMLRYLLHLCTQRHRRRTPVVRSCPCAPFCDQEHGRLYPRGGSRVEFFCGGGRRRGPVVESCEPRPLSGRRPFASPVDPRTSRGSGLRCWPAASRERPTTGPASVQTSVTPHHLNSTSYTQNSFSFYRNPNLCP